MKINTLSLLLIFVIAVISCREEDPIIIEPETNIWIEKSVYSGGYLTNAVSFVIGDNLYVGTGINDSFVDYFYKYIYKDDFWFQTASLPSNPRSNGISFAVGDYGYVGLGENCIGIGFCTPVYYNDLWRYNPLQDRWERMSDFPGTPRAESTCFVIGDKAYVTGGNSSEDNDVWEYNTLTDTWTQKADFPGDEHSRTISFSLNSKGYVGFGGGVEPSKEIWEYSPASDSWSRKEDFPGDPRSDAVGFAAMGKGYVGCGAYRSYTLGYSYLNDIWQYNQLNDSWTQLETHYPGKGRINMIGNEVDERIIIGLGSDGAHSGPDFRFDDIWEFVLEIN